MRMKLTKYISVLVTILLVFSAVWIIFCVANTKVYKTVNNENVLDVPADIGWTSLISLIVLCFFFVSSILGIAWYSIKIMFRFYKEKSLWKILTLCFGVGMILFSFVIAGFGIRWIIGAITKGVDFFKTINFNGGISFDYNKIWKYFCELTNNTSSNTMEFGSYITVFVCMVLWSVAGIVYEIIKKLLGGNKRKQSNSVSNQ